MSEPMVTRWQGAHAPTEQEIRRHMAEEGLDPYRWSNEPGDLYGPHSHGYNKVIYVVSGSIVFGLPDMGAELRLEPGDRLDLPAGIVHDARVGRAGVVCLEAHR